MRTIDDLAEQVAYDSGRDPGTIRRKVLDVAKSTLCDIGKKFCCQVLTEKFDIKSDRNGYGKIRVPEKMFLPLVNVKVEGYSRSLLEGTPSVKSQKIDYFYTTSQEIVFPNISNGVAFIEFYTFYTNEEGDMLIGDIEYNAVFQSCMYEVLKSSVNNPRNDKAMLYRQDAMDAKSKATAEYNQFGINKIKMAYSINNRR